MAANNLRIIHNNIADTATITSTATAVGYPTSNLQNDTKGLVWRSTSLASTTITLSWASDQIIGGVILPFTNLSTSATIRVVCKNSAATVLYDSGTVQAVPYVVPANGASNYSYGGGATARAYTTSILSTVRSVEVTLVDSGNTQGYMEVSRIVCGSYWSPTYNTEYGLSVDYKDTSQHSRTQAGNILTEIATAYKTLNFSLGYMNAADRNTLVRILRQNGMRKSLWISLFPLDTEPEKEYIYSVYGKLSQSATITHPQFSQYASTITIEEV